MCVHVLNQKKNHYRLITNYYQLNNIFINKIEWDCAICTFFLSIFPTSSLIGTYNNHLQLWEKPPTNLKETKQCDSKHIFSFSVNRVSIINF